jgi:predicted RNase H-like nuclease (RuvC/YqgF family)
MLTEIFWFALGLAAATITHDLDKKNIEMSFQKDADIRELKRRLEEAEERAADAEGRCDELDKELQEKEKEYHELYVDLESTNDRVTDLKEKLASADTTMEMMITGIVIAVASICALVYIALLKASYQQINALGQ